MAESCSYPHCRAKVTTLIYMGRDLCARCWLRICEIEDYFRIAALLKLGRRCVVTEKGIVKRGS